MIYLKPAAITNLASQSHLLGSTLTPNDPSEQSVLHASGFA